MGAKLRGAIVMPRNEAELYAIGRASRRTLVLLTGKPAAQIPCRR